MEYMWTQDLAGSGTKELDVEGKVVVPGFIDSHVHLIFGGLQVSHQSYDLIFMYFVKCGISLTTYHELWLNCC